MIRLHTFEMADECGLEEASAQTVRVEQLRLNPTGALYC